MLKETEQLLINTFRINSRKSLNSISRENNIPISTLFDTYNRIRNKKLFIRHYPILNFESLGYKIRVFATFHADNIDYLVRVFSSRKVVNNILRTDVGIFTECVFLNVDEYSLFKEDISNSFITCMEEVLVVSELKKEGKVI